MVILFLRLSTLGEYLIISLFVIMCVIFGARVFSYVHMSLLCEYYFLCLDTDDLCI